jgi:gliding motility-associated-like protein
MKNFLFLFIIFSSFTFVRAGGCGDGTGGTQQFPAGPNTPPPSCINSQPAGNTCETATPICNLNGYCGSTASSYTASNMDWCELRETFCGLTIENNSFLTFVASETSISFDIWLTSSTLNYGIQLMIFSSAAPCSGSVTNHACWNLGSIPTGSTTITANNLTPGNTYYIMVDGNANDVVSYVIAANSGIEVGLELEASSTTICAGESVDLTVSGGNGTYNWTASPDLSATSGANVTATPPAPGSFTYSVNSASGNPLCPTDVTQSVTITVNDCGGCIVTATNSGNICESETVNLFATSIAGATYSWTGPNGYTSLEQNPTNISLPTTPGSYVFTVTVNDNGYECTSSTTVVVHPNPIVDAGSDLSICAGESVILIASGATTYSWTNGVINGETFIPVTTTNYTVTGTNEFGCTDTDDILITVSEILTPTFNEIQPLCQNDIAPTLPTTSLNGISGTWDGIIQTANEGTFDFTFTPSNPTCTNTAQITIVVNPLPVVNAGSDVTICAGESVTLTATGADSYSWNNSVTNGVTFTPTSSTTYNVTGTDVNGCQNIDQVIVTVNALPNVNAGPDVAVCAGESVTLSGSGATGYDWNNGITNGTPFTPTVTITYTVTGTGANGCVGSDQVVVTVNPIPTINAGADVTICAGSSVVLNATGGATYVWSSGTSNGGSVSPGTTTTYTVTGTTAAGCSNTDEITITVLPVPNAEFTADAITGYPVHTVNFTNNSTNANNYTWAFGNGVVIPATNTDDQSSSYGETGTYTVILFASNGICSDSTSIEIIVLPFPDAIIYIPNVFTPNGDNSNDEWFIDAKFAASLNVQVFNRWGNMMLEMDDVTDKWDGRIDGKDASAGVYFYKYIATDLNGKEYTGHGSFTLIR